MQFNYMTGTVNWAKVLGDPVPNYNRDGFEWTFDFTPDEAGLVLLKKLKIADKLKNKGDDRENFIQFKQKAKQHSGKDNRPITVVDARNHPWDPNSKIGNGSTIEVKFSVVPYPGKPTGVYPQAIRVLEYKEYVRQEFAPLPEDSQYFQPIEDGATELAPVPEGDPLNA